MLSFICNKLLNIPVMHPLTTSNPSLTHLLTHPLTHHISSSHIPSNALCHPPEHPLIPLERSRRTRTKYLLFVNGCSMPNHEPVKHRLTPLSMPRYCCHHYYYHYQCHTLPLPHYYHHHHHTTTIIATIPFSSSQHGSLIIPGP